MPATALKIKDIHLPTLAAFTAGLGVTSFAATTALTGTLSSYLGGAGDVLFTLADLCLTPFRGDEAMVGEMGEMAGGGHGTHRALAILATGGALAALFSREIAARAFGCAAPFDDAPVYEAMARVGHLAGVSPEAQERLFEETFARAPDQAHLLATYHDPQLFSGPEQDLRRRPAAVRHMTMVAALRVASHHGDMCEGAVAEIAALADRLGMEDDTVRRIFARMMGVTVEPGPSVAQRAAKTTGRVAKAGARVGEQAGIWLAWRAARGLRKVIHAGLPRMRAAAKRVANRRTALPERAFPTA